jgi:predicted HD phosphohydrolase
MNPKENDWKAVRNHIVDSYRQAASIRYGQSAVTELEHSLQCAELADQAGADEELVIACMLHDVARSAVPQEQVSDTLQSADVAPDAKNHGEAAAELMKDMLPERSLFCIRYHAEAKQYLCQVNPAYRDRLADASIQTLAVQSDSTSREKLDTLANHRFWKDALRVRTWDDGAKVRDRETRPLDYWINRLDEFLAEIPREAAG